MPRPKLINIAGQRFGRLTVLQKAGNSINGAALWLCKCDCGKTIKPSGTDIRKGRIWSCGCGSIDLGVARRTTHGKAGTRLYRIWSGMHNRCRNHKTNGFKSYGGRGITVCEEWASFETFQSWAINAKYADNLTIDRIDNSRSYSPSNCTWTTLSAQSINRDYVRKAESGETYFAIAKRNGLAGAFYSRVRRGWSLELAATRPSRS